MQYCAMVKLGLGKLTPCSAKSKKKKTSETKHEKDTNDVEDLGIVPRMLSELFQKISLAAKIFISSMYV